MHIAHVTSEALPFAKTGGLADVTFGLSRALVRRGHSVTVVMPAYRLGAGEPPGEATERTVEAQGCRFVLRRSAVDGIDYLLLDAPRLFARPALYGTADGDFPDNPIRFAAFARAAVLALAAAAGGPDVVHCHDWQAALIPTLLGRDAILGRALAQVPTVLTIHNLGYQGSFPSWALEAAALPRRLYHPEALEFYGLVNFLKGGIKKADRLTTVSPTYAREILRPELGCGLDGVLSSRAEHLSGILNGLDTEEWNPARDRHLSCPLVASDLAQAKRRCRAALAAEMELQEDGSLLAVMVTRLAGQKGIDVVARTVNGLVAQGVRLAVLGSGERELEDALRSAAVRHPGRVAVRLGFDAGLAHRMYAGADLFLMPSRYEPCGLGQLIALRYGVLPVVNPTGGLADTIRDLGADPETGNGFHLHRLTPEGLGSAVGRALELFAEPRRLAAVRRRAMAEDHGWDRAAAEYEALYGELVP